MLFIPAITSNSLRRLILQIVASFLYLITSYCHIRCVFCNPGAVPHNAYPLMEQSCEDGELLQRCGICDAFKPRKSHHCRICNRCILKMDHHCPWINNCVGMLNMKLFLLFLFYAFLFCTFVFFCTIIAAFHGIVSSDTGKAVVVTISIVICLIYPCLFAVFCVIIFIDTLKTALTGETKIDRLKELHHEENNLLVNLSEVFGDQGHFSLSWFLPIMPEYDNFESLAEYMIDRSGKRWNIYTSESE